ncbi:hypothetical protein EB077_09100, partial [bacterium]|nr:hypothetical protein [bacterium]
MLIPWIRDTMEWYMGKKLQDCVSFADIFSGSGVCTYMAIDAGIKRVISNDIQYYAYILSSVWTTQDLCIGKIQGDIECINNELEGIVVPESLEQSDYITRTYAGERMFFTRENAYLIDYTRKWVSRNTYRYTENEYRMMIKLILYAAVAVSNVSSTFASYLKDYKKGALRKFRIEGDILRLLLNRHDLEHRVYNANVFDLDVEAEVVYIDSPYNARRYDKNYFVLEAIARHDNMHVTGKTGIRESTDSCNKLFCSKRTVEESFRKLLRDIRCKYIFISYNEESLISKDDMIKIMENALFTNII